MSNSEDLEFNPFYQAIQSRYIQQYEQAQQVCWLVCVPTTASLGGCLVNRQFVEMHLLEPSQLFRDSYFSSAGGVKLKWQLSGSVLQCVTDDMDVRATVLSEELAYNKALQQFRLFIISRPLDPSYKPTEKEQTVQSLLKLRRTHREHRELLESFSAHQEPLQELEEHIGNFNRHYLIVETVRLLQDTALKLEGITRKGSLNFLEANSKDKRLRDRRVKQAVCMAVESWLMHRVSEKVLKAVRAVHAREDRAFAERCRQLRGHLTPSSVDVSKDYHCSYRTTLAHLDTLDRHATPLEKMCCLQDAMDSVIHDVQDHFTRSLRLGEPQPLASEDLISLLSTILIHAKCVDFISSLYYMEHFHWSIADADKLSYVLVTFRAAVEFLRGPEAAKFIPVEEKPLPQEQEVTDEEEEEEEEEERGPESKAQLPQALLATMVRPSPQGEAQDGSRSSLPGQPASRKEHTPKSPRTKELGPFLSMLLENDDTVTSTAFYDSQ